MRHVEVRGVSIPAMATMGRCVGLDVETGEVVVFAADHRPARRLGEAVAWASDQGEDPPVAEVEDWQVLQVDDPPTPEAA